VNTLHEIRFPNETDEYRRERDELLRAELELSARVEQVAARRRKLPRGGAVPEDYAFRASADGETVRLSELFEDGKSTLIVYTFMYSGDMEQPCPMCSSFLDGMDAQAIHLTQRVNFAVVAKSPPERLREWAAGRGWSHLRLLSWQDTNFGRDYHAETPGGNQLSVMHVFTKDGSAIHHTWASELPFATVDGQPRHVDQMWPLWNALDLTPEGRGTDWLPPLHAPAPEHTGAGAHHCH